ncbi:hypothetical protein BGZ88_011215, partial [Linnemannia elongata]
QGANRLMAEAVSRGEMQSIAGVEEATMMSRSSEIVNIYMAVAGIVKSAGGGNIVAARSAAADSLCVVCP